LQEWLQKIKITLAGVAGFEPTACGFGVTCTRNTPDSQIIITNILNIRNKSLVGVGVNFTNGCLDGCKLLRRMAMNFVQHHIVMALRAAIAESNGFTSESAQLRAQGYLRLIVMNDDEITELAHHLSNPPIRNAETIEIELLSRIDELTHTAGSWIPDLTRDPADFVSTN